MLKEIDYKNDDDAKPPYSYAALICLSMKDTKKKMTLSQIYKWIRDNFAYYRKADKSWQVRRFTKIVKIESRRNPLECFFNASKVIKVGFAYIKET